MDIDAGAMVTNITDGFYAVGPLAYPVAFAVVFSLIAIVVRVLVMGRRDEPGAVDTSSMRVGVDRRMAAPGNRSLVSVSFGASIFGASNESKIALVQDRVKLKNQKTVVEIAGESSGKTAGDSPTGNEGAEGG